MGGNVNEAIRKKFAEAEELFVHNGYDVVNPAGEAHQEQVRLAVMIAKDKCPNEVKDYTVDLHAARLAVVSRCQGRTGIRQGDGHGDNI